jgi:hypothetical protein
MSVLGSKVRWWRAVPISALLVLALAPAALADPITGGCTLQADSGIDQTNVDDAVESDPFMIDPEGRISWLATSPAPITNHTWEITVQLGGSEVPIASGGSPNSEQETESSGDESVAAIIDRLPEPAQTLVEQSSGVYRVSASIEGDGGSCSGSAWVELTGFGGIGIAAAVLAAIGLVMLFFAGRPRSA